MSADGNEELFGNDDDDDDSLEEEANLEENPQQQEEGAANKPTEAEKQQAAETKDDDAFADSEDDDDDDEAEATLNDDVEKKTDDDGEKDASTNSKKRDAPDEGNDYDDHHDDEDEFNGDEGIIGESAPPPPKTTQNAVVLEVNRPNPDLTLHMTKLPNLVGIQPEAFDFKTYSAAREEEEYRGYVHNMIRWRYKHDGNGNLLRDDDGKLIRESNARLVEWEDGSYTLHIGKEALEVDTIVGTGGASAKNPNNQNSGYLYLSQTATLDDEEKGTMLECLGTINSKWIARPSSLQSEAHKSLTVAVRQRTIKKAKIAEYVTQFDPEKAKQERIRNNQDLGWAAARKRAASRSASTSRRRPGMNRGYLEDEEGYDTYNVASMKRGDEMDDYGEESEDDTFGPRGKPSARLAKKAAQEEEEDDEVGIGHDESEDEDVGFIGKAKKRHNAVLDDDDDSE